MQRAGDQVSPARCFFARAGMHSFRTAALPAALFQFAQSL
jgi:hypothetical protein